MSRGDEHEAVYGSKDLLFYLLPKQRAACYSSVPRKTPHTLQSETKKKRGVDEINETLHNLASVLMNTTLQQQAIPVFKKLQSINVGV
jgi:hypothetical protein